MVIDQSQRSIGSCQCSLYPVSGSWYFICPRRYGKVVKCVTISVASLRRCWKFLCKPLLLRGKNRQPLYVRTCLRACVRVHDEAVLKPILTAKTRITKRQIRTEESRVSRVTFVYVYNVTRDGYRYVITAKEIKPPPATRYASFLPPSLLNCFQSFCAIRPV